MVHKTLLLSPDAAAELGKCSVHASSATCKACVIGTAYEQLLAVCAALLTF